MKKSLLFLFVLCSGTVFSQWVTQTSGTTSDLNDVHFINGATGWAVGRNGALVHTTDGGTTWSAQNSATTKDLNDVFMVDATTGFAVGDNGTVIKFNGTSWSALTSGTTRDLFGVYFLDANTGWICGDWGQIRKTTNGGSSWVEENNHVTYSNLFNDIYMVDASNGWAVGTSGRILKYNGSGWSSQTSGITTELLGCFFTGTNSGFAVGKSSQILYYNGSAWSTHNSGLTSYNIHNIFIVNSNLAYAATSDGFGGVGIILKYNGSVWSKDYEYTGIGTEIFYGIYCTSASHAVAVGAGGLIKKQGSATGLDNASANGDIKRVYPNPFSNSISIEFSMKTAGEVSIVLADITGRKVKTITKEIYKAGNHIVDFNGSTLPGGVYFYTISSGENTTSGKLVKQ